MKLNKSVGTTALFCYAVPYGKTAQVTIQNLSVNNVYIIDNGMQAVANGIKLLAGAVSTNETFRGQLWLIADGVTSDIRIDISFEGSEP